MIFRYSLTETRETIELFAPDRESAETQVKALLERIPYGGEFDPKWLRVESEANYRIYSNDYR